MVAVGVVVVVVVAVAVAVAVVVVVAVGLRGGGSMSMLTLDPALVEKYANVQVVTHDQVQWNASVGYVLLAIVEQQVFVAPPEAPSHMRPTPEPPRVLSTCLFVMGRTREADELVRRLKIRDDQVHKLEDDVTKLQRERDALTKEVEQLKLAQRLAEAGSGKVT
jgi:hypothetical protein